MPWNKCAEYSPLYVNSYFKSIVLCASPGVEISVENYKKSIGREVLREGKFLMLGWKHLER